MGINVQLQDENGGKVVDIEHALPSALGFTGQRYDLRDFPLTSGIDGYGDTIFNRMQMPQFLREWSSLKGRVEEPDLQVMDEVERLAKTL